MPASPGMKVKKVKTKTFDAASAAALDTAIATFISGLAEETFLELQFAVTYDSGGAATVFAAQLTYTA